MIELRKNPALDFGTSSSNHSYGYAFSDDAPNSGAEFSLNLIPFVQYPG